MSPTRAHEPVPQADPPQRAGRPLPRGGGSGWGWALAVVGLVLLLAACGRPAPRNNLDYTHDDQFAIEDPGGRQATATGMGCGLSYKDAQTQAEHTARYNLRGVMGPGRYRIRVDRVRQYRDQERYCAEVIAHAVF